MNIRLRSLDKYGYSLRETARIFATSVPRIKKLIDKGQLRCTVLDNLFFISCDAIHDYLNTYNNFNLKSQGHTRS